MKPLNVVLCFLLRERDGVRSVLLGHKKTGFGTGKVVGVGGKLEPGEGPLEAVCREVLEETGVVVRPEALVPAGRIFFDFPYRPALNMDTLLYVTRSWEGEPGESDEIAPEWYDVERLPLELMWHDAGTWLPLALDGHGPNLRIILNEDNATVRAAVPL